VFLADFLSAVGAPGRAALVEAVPEPALLELPAEALASSSALAFDAEPEEREGEVRARLTRLLDHPGWADLKLYFLKPGRSGEPVDIGAPGGGADVELADAGLDPRHAQFFRRKELWRVTDLESRLGTRLEGGRLRAGIPLPIVGGQEVSFGEYHTVFLEPETLQLLVGLGAQADLRRRLPRAGLAVREALDLFAGLARADVKDPDLLPPFLLQVPTEGGDTKPSGEGEAMTRRVPPELIRGLSRSKQAGQARLHLLTPRGDDPLAPVDLGRAPDCDVVLPEASVSKRHSQVRRLRSGRYGVIDHGSNNGTYLDGQLLPSGVLAPLAPGSQLWFSSYRALFLTPPQVYDLLARLRKR